MKKYQVSVCLPMWLNIVVEAENEEDACNTAMDAAEVTQLDHFEVGESYVPDGCCEFFEEV